MVTTINHSLNYPTLPVTTLKHACLVHKLEVKCYLLTCGIVHCTGRPNSLDPRVDGALC